MKEKATSFVSKKFKFCFTKNVRNFSISFRKTIRLLRFVNTSTWNSLSNSKLRYLIKTRFKSIFFACWFSNVVFKMFRKSIRNDSMLLYFAATIFDCNVVFWFRCFVREQIKKSSKRLWIQNWLFAIMTRQLLTIFANYKYCLRKMIIQINLFSADLNRLENWDVFFVI